MATTTSANSNNKVVGAQYQQRNVSTTPGFCPGCGSILPPLESVGDIVCYTCRTAYSPDVLGTSVVKYTIPFNVNKVREEKTTNKFEGVEVERICPKCGNNKMSYATAQLRSADEGQTVFYKCSKCGHTEAENS